MIAKKMKMNKSTISAYCNRNGLAGVGGAGKPAETTTVYTTKRKRGSAKKRDIVCTVKVTFEPWKPNAV